MNKKDIKDVLLIDGKIFNSRLIMGTSLFPNQSILKKSLDISEAEIVTVAIRRVDLTSDINIFNLFKDKYSFLPNTAGCYTSKEAILTAELSREALKTDWIKLELIADEETLLPDSIELLNTAKILIERKFKIFAYCNDDPIICKKLEDLGCVAVMPLISPIGSGLGIRNEHNLELIRQVCKGILIVDAGIGKPSDANRVMELGYDGVLLNSSVARSQDPMNMAEAMKLAIMSGRKGFLSGIIEKNKLGIRSTINSGKITNF